MNVTVFGSANASPNTPLYENAFQLGSLLAQAGHNVITGGYTGTMEAVSRGAFEKGGKSIGVTCAEIESFRPGAANPWVQIVISTETLTERLDRLIRRADVLIALPGGIGTLAELSLALNLISIGAIQARCLILIGPVWEKTLKTFFTEGTDFIPEALKAWIFYAANSRDAVNLLQKNFSQ